MCDWPRRWWLLVHIATGIVALLAGPVQLWLGLTDRRPCLHRRLGMMYVGAVAVSAAAGYYLAFRTSFGWVFGAGLAGLATAWILTTGLALAAIRRGRVEQHKEWMIRSYVMTTAFVTFRVLFTTEIGAGRHRHRVGATCCSGLVLLGGSAAVHRSGDTGAEDLRAAERVAGLAPSPRR